MKIRSWGEVCEVYAVHISFDEYSLKEQRITFYHTTKETFGLGVEDLRSAVVVDNALGPDFILHIDKELTGVTILWNHFESIEHLAELIDLDPDRVKAFEAARVIREREKGLS